MGGTMLPGKVEIRTPQSRSQIVLDEWQCDRPPIRLDTREDPGGWEDTMTVEMEMYNFFHFLDAAEERTGASD